ncbi:succinate semialdehyde dehydrogenase NADP+ linked [Diplodia intermedia]|uniref:Succinate semialdehyde dehydrogenase NADP+ linked n=1 Tax=Diplodia intermedia TaxID=856260 RepID=A0ABR3TBT0_9PEZI
MDATVGPCSRVEKERLVMSDDLRTSMRRTPADRVIAKLDGQSQQLELSERTDAVVHGPFAVFKLPPPTSPGTLPEANEENRFLSEFLPDIDMIPEVVDFGDEQFVAALSAIDQMFDPEQQPYPDEIEQCDNGLSTSWNPTGSFLTPYLNPYPESMAHQDASLLLNHYKNRVIRLLSPLKYQRKTPWDILQLPCAMTTLAEITMGYRTNHARASVFYGVMSISAFNLSASSTSTAKAHWNGVASSYRLQAHESLKASLEHEMSAQKKAKYKEMLMAILCMVTISPPLHANDTAADDDDEDPLAREKSFALGVHDLHLAIPGDFAAHTLYPAVYGLPESLMQLISQTTRLGNERDAIITNNPDPNPATTTTTRFFRRARTVERAILRLQRDDDDDDDDDDDGVGGQQAEDGAVDPAAVASNRRALAHLRRALRSALVVYFYRRVRDDDVDADASAVLRAGVERTIEHLEAVQREDELEQAARGKEGEGGIEPHIPSASASMLDVVTALENTPEIGRVLCEAPEERKMSFTGSTRVGKLLMRQCSESLKKLSLELGGNAPFVAFDDADLDTAVSGLVASKFKWSSQTCVCGNRIYVQSGIHDAFVSRLREVVGKFRVGSGFDDTITHHQSK